MKNWIGWIRPRKEVRRLAVFVCVPEGRELHLTTYARLTGHTLTSLAWERSLYSIAAPLATRTVSL